MSNFLKWIGGGIGWALGGPIGAILGFALGSAIGGSSTKKKQIYTRTTEQDFKASLLVMMACVMKADGKVQRSELNVVKRFLVANFGEEGALEALQMLKKILDQSINEMEVAQQINRYMNHSAKLQLVRFLFDVAYADGHVNEAELLVIRRISAIFNISNAEFESLKAPYMKHVDVNWAYKALEIEPSASNDDIKKAYRRMAMKFHPDKVANLGEDIKKSATEKFRAVNEAYEHLKKMRNFV
ncbi:MAG TPA: TerB family tellurite resistance protein [Paludibacter sp.]|nr:TerB family tellurite resistance protein [Paludibacter sp.]